MEAWTHTALDMFGRAGLQYGSSWGFDPLRQWLSEELNYPAERIMVGNGSINLLAYLIDFLLRPGDRVLVENPTYDRARLLLELSGALIYGIDLTDDGFDTEQFEVAVKKHTPRLVYVISEFNNPSGARMSLTAREKIADLAETYDFMIIDDGAYYRLRLDGSPITPLRDLAPRHTITLGSFTKLLAPGLRTGWALLPDDLTPEFARFIENRMISPNHFAQSVVTAAVMTPDYTDYLTQITDIFRKKRDVMVHHLTEKLAPLGAKWVHAEGGYFIGLTLPPTPTPIWDAVPRDRLILLNGDDFFVNKQNTNFIRLPFASLDIDEIEQGLEVLARSYTHLV